MVRWIFGYGRRGRSDRRFELSIQQQQLVCSSQLRYFGGRGGLVEYRTRDGGMAFARPLKIVHTPVVDHLEKPVQTTKGENPIGRMRIILDRCGYGGDCDCDWPFFTQWAERRFKLTTTGKRAGSSH
ncbi:hypothetical protein FRC18_001123 [Serendipita sp. 400]|nr:hypothetical protein FRC18_001123 [Serendipita sp. 400]